MTLKTGLHSGAYIIIIIIITIIIIIIIILIIIVIIKCLSEIINHTYCVKPGAATYSD